MNKDSKKRTFYEGSFFVVLTLKIMIKYRQIIIDEAFEPIFGGKP